MRPCQLWENKTMRSVGRILFLVSVVLGFVGPRAHATPEKEFVMSCTYGVLAGTLVGAASLAFVDNPGDNLQTVARGASLGLYMGIGLGYYTAYILPKQLEKQEDKILEGESDESSMPSFMVFPIASEKGIDGVGGFIQFARF